MSESLENVVRNRHSGVIIPGAPQLSCPSCGASETARVAVVYAQGTRTGTHTSLIGLGGDLGLAVGSTGSQTHFARYVSPPLPPGSFAVVCLTAITILFFLMGSGATALVIANSPSINLPGLAIPAVPIFLGLVFTLFSVLAAGSRRRKIAQYRIEFRRWNASWVCLRCGTTFRP